MNYNISDSEWAVLRILWRQNPLTADEIVERIPETMEWKSKTIKTLINRLLNKGFIAFSKEGRKYLYYPIVDEKKSIRKKNFSFLDSIYGGARNKLYSSFVEDLVTSREEIDELMAIIRKREKELESGQQNND